MLGFNGGTIGVANTVFTGSKSDDPNYSDVSLLLNGNGSNNSTTFTDSSSSNHTITVTGSVSISIAQFKFGNSSMYFNGGYVRAPNSSGFAFGTGDFTVEAWLRGRGSFLETRTGLYSAGFGFGVSSTSNTISIWDGQGSSHAYNGSNAYDWTNWHHVAISRSGTTLRVFVDGSLDGTATTSRNLTGEGGIVGANINKVVNAPSANVFSGYIDDLRVTKGVARYTSNFTFTPPTAQLPGGETGTFASGMWTPSSHIKQIHNELWPGFVLPYVDWQASNLLTYTNSSFTIPSSSLAANDLIVFAFGDDTDTPTLSNSSITTTQLVRVDSNSIGRAIYYGVVPATPSNITVQIDGEEEAADYGVIMRFRRSGSTSSYNVSVEATNETDNDPSHNNASIAFDEGDLALLLAFVDDDATPMGAPTGSTKISEDQNSGNGSIGAAYKQIEVAGNYSWGSWATSGTDDTAAYVIKIQEA